MAKNKFSISKREAINLSINIVVMLCVALVCYVGTSLIEWEVKLTDWSDAGKYFWIIATYSIIKSLHNYGK